MRIFLGEIFSEWLEELDKQMEDQGRKILLYLDNVATHKVEYEPKNITLRFFPPNTTALSQPMDQGVIANFKFHYKKLLLRDRVNRIDHGEDTKINILEALRFAEQAWENVTATTINRCFKKANFVRDGVDVDMEVSIFLVEYGYNDFLANKRTRKRGGSTCPRRDN